MENNTLAVLVAVILMGFTAVAMITTAEVKPVAASTVQFDAPFPNQHNTSDLGQEYSPN